MYELIDSVFLIKFCIIEHSSLTAVAFRRLLSVNFAT